MADNTSAARYVVGAPVNPRDVDLRLAGVVLAKKDQSWRPHPVRQRLDIRPLPSRGSHVSSRQRGRAFVLARSCFRGSLTAAVPVAPGDVVTASVDRLGSLELGCR